MSSKRRKPVLSLAAAIHRATPSPLVAASAASAPGSGVASSAAGAPAVAGKKRKRAAQLISAFHVLQREQDALQSRKGSMKADAYAAAHAALQARLAELGGLETYQSLSIAGHSNTKYVAFNTSHWVMDVLASYPEFANLKQFVKGKRAPSGTTAEQARAASSGGAGASGADADGTPVDRKLLRRQKEREKKRARKRAKKAEEEAAEAAKAQAAAPNKKGGKAGAKAAAASVPKGGKASKAAESDDEADDASEAEGEDEDDDDGENHNVPSASSAASASAPVFSSSNRVKLLDVGSLTNHYLPYASQVDCTAIDLNPQHPSVQRKDFFDLDAGVGGKLSAAFDVVVLSLVLNFVGDRFQRGEMIKRSVRMLRRDGLGRVFIVLPAACLNNSRWMSHDTFVNKCMAPLGLKLGQWKFTTKLACYEFIKVEATVEQMAEEAAEAKAEAEEAEKAKKSEGEAEHAENDTMEEAEANGGVIQVKAGAPTAVAAPVKKKRKGFQPAGVVLAGETRNNFSIAWRAD